MSQTTPIHPKDFKVKHGWSLSRLHQETKIPIDTLRGFLSPPDSNRYREPKPYICAYFGEIDYRISTKIK